ncbi:MAG: hypothetical protein RBT66_09415 [bacterium]|jgi:hypothetical protein|nr:hypothetical protein [bacterium]
MDKEIKNAKIIGTMLGIEDHSILTCWLYLNYDGAGQGFGGYALDTYDKVKSGRIGTAFGMEFIRRIMEVVEVEKWEDLTGQYCRVFADHSRVYKIGHIIKDQWFDPDVEFKQGA